MLFIATSNQLGTIHPALLDRMEIISLAGYTEEEKLHIARRYLVPRQLDEHGLTAGDVDDRGRCAAPDHRRVHARGRRAQPRAADRRGRAEDRRARRDRRRRPQRGSGRHAHRRAADRRRAARRRPSYLGPPRFHDEVAFRVSRPGVATGVAWTETGGDVLFVEASLLPAGHHNVILTGQLGSVMQESARAAVSHIRAAAERARDRRRIPRHHDLHVHVPAGAIPKDGPSAGVTMATAIVSALRNQPVREDVAMTGEITLSGLVLPVGGIREKALAARRHGIKTFILPARNEPDLAELPPEVRDGMRFVPVATLEEAPRASALPGDREAPAARLTGFRPLPARSCTRSLKYGACPLLRLGPRVRPRVAQRRSDEGDPRARAWRGSSCARRRRAGSSSRRSDAGSIVEPMVTDTGVIQSDSLGIDTAATALAARAFYHASSAHQQRRKSDAPTSPTAALVGRLRDIPPLAFAAAHASGIPSVAVANFTWDWIYAGLRGVRAARPGVVDRIRELVPRARRWRCGCRSAAASNRWPPSLRTSRSSHAMPAVACGHPSPARSRRIAPVVLASFGGHGLRLPYGTIAERGRFTLIVTDHETTGAKDAGTGHAARPEGRAYVVPQRNTRHSYRSTYARLAALGLQYEDLVAAADVVVSKPGYGIVSECIANGAALLYALRAPFPEQRVLVREMPRFLRCREIHKDDLLDGHWSDAIEALVQQPPPPERMRTDGASVAAEKIVSMCRPT